MMKPSVMIVDSVYKYAYDVCAFNTTLEIEMDNFLLVGRDDRDSNLTPQRVLFCETLEEAKELSECWLTTVDGQDTINVNKVGIFRLVMEGKPPTMGVQWTEIPPRKANGKANGVHHRGPNEKTRRAGRRWTATEDKALIQARKRGKGIAEIAIDMDRSEKAIAVRAARIGATRK